MVVPGRARTIVQRHAAQWARCPQLKRDPLGRCHMHPHRLLRATLLLSTTALVTISCFSSPRLFQTGIITSRAPRGVGNRLVPAMLVVDDTSFRHRPCGHILYYLTDHVRVVHQNGINADTGALTVGRRVSVYVTKDQAVYLSCPPITSAAKVVVH